MWFQVLPKARKRSFGEKRNGNRTSRCCRSCLPPVCTGRETVCKGSSNANQWQEMTETEQASFPLPSSRRLVCKAWLLIKKRTRTFKILPWFVRIRHFLSGGPGNLHLMNSRDTFDKVYLPAKTMLDAGELSDRRRAVWEIAPFPPLRSRVCHSRSQSC